MGLVEDFAERFINQLEDISERLERLEQRNEYNTDIKLLKADEAAEKLGISREKAYTMARKNELPSIKMGRKVLFPRKKLVSWIEENTIEAKQDEKIAI